MSENDNTQDSTQNAASETAAEAAETTTPPPQPEPSGNGQEPGNEERTWALFSHISALAGFLIPIPGSNCLGPLVIWLMKKEEMPFVDEQGKEALNFQITVALAVLVSALLTVVLIGFLLLPVVGIGALVLTIIATVKANSGEHYRYPVSWRLIN